MISYTRYYGNSEMRDLVQTRAGNEGNQKKSENTPGGVPKGDLKR